MKAISLWQPYATLIALGSKTRETRSWQTSYRGPLAIHAAKTANGTIRQIAGEHPFREALLRGGYQTFNRLPFGFYVAVAQLDACLRTDDCRASVGEREIAFGDFSPGRFAWRLTGVRRLDPPLAAVGRQGLWDVPAGVVAQLEAAAVSPEVPLPARCPQCGLGRGCACGSDLFASARS